QNGLICAHGQLPAQDLLALLVVDGDHGDIPAYAVANLQRFLDSVVVCLIHRVHELVAFNVISRGSEFDLVLRGVGHSSCAYQNFHVYPPEVTVSNSCVFPAGFCAVLSEDPRIMCWSTSSVRSITDIFPSSPATLMASSMLTMQNGQAVTMT